jgi:hypothetical protein
LISDNLSKVAAIDEGFKKELLSAIDKGPLVLGESVKHAIYYHVERKHQLRREEIPEKIESFHKALQSLLGAGAEVLEKLIAKDLYGRLGLNFEEHEGWTIVDYVNQGEKSRKQLKESQVAAGFHGRILLR